MPTFCFAFFDGYNLLGIHNSCFIDICCEFQFVFEETETEYIQIHKDCSQCSCLSNLEPAYYSQNIINTSELHNLQTEMMGHFHCVTFSLSNLIDELTNSSNQRGYEYILNWICQVIMFFNIFFYDDIFPRIYFLWFYDDSL